MVTIKFGTDGWRAVMDKEFTFENVERVAQAFALWLRETPRGGASKTPRVAIGYDFRDRSEDFAAAFARVLLGNGIQIALSDRPVPTPAVSRAVLKHGYDAGIGITASHNPGQYNGVKIKDSEGASADPAVTRRVEDLIDTGPVKKDAAADLKPHLRNLLADYLDGVKSYLDLGAFKRKPFRILVDSMHGVGEHHIENILRGSAVEVTTIRGERDIHFGGNAPEPILKNLAMAAELMKQGKFDLCLVTDGDADRIGALRPGGAFVSPGTILTLIMLHLAQDLGKRGTVVTTVSNTSLIYRVARKLGLPVVETPVGFKYICDVMRKENVLIAGEESGGLAFQGYMRERDGVLSGLLLVQMMERRGKTFEEILGGVESEFGRFRYVRRDLRYPDELKPKLLEYLKNLEPDTIGGGRVTGKNLRDGVKFLIEGDAWVLFRLSGTEPLLRVYAESADASQAEALAQWGESLAFSLA
jgi:phosphomannomutase